MNLLWEGSRLLAEIGTGASPVAGRWRMPDLATWWPVLAGLVLLLLLGGAIYLVRRYQDRRNQPGFADHDDLWAELGDAHELDRDSRQLVTDLARALAIEPTAQLLLLPELWEEDRLPAALHARRGELAALRARLFD